MAEMGTAFYDELRREAGKVGGKPVRCSPRPKH